MTACCRSSSATERTGRLLRETGVCDGFVWVSNRPEVDDLAVPQRPDVCQRELELEAAVALMAAIRLPGVVGEVVVFVDDVGIEEIEIEDLASLHCLRRPVIAAPRRQERAKGLDIVLRHNARSIAAYLANARLLRSS